MKLCTKSLARYFFQNINMISANVPDWLIELNEGNIDYDYFGNAQDFVEREFVYQIFDNALTTICLYWMRAREGNGFIPNP